MQREKNGVETNMVGTNGRGGVDSFDELTEFVVRLVVKLVYVRLAAAVVELVEAHHFDIGVFLHQQEHHM